MVTVNRTFNKSMSMIVGVLSAILVLGIVWAYARISAPSHELRNQLKALIASHDEAKIEAISYDTYTAKLLEKLPSDASVGDSDFEGGGSPRPGVVLGYFPVKVGHQQLACYMAERTSGFSLVPHWKLVKVSATSVRIDPKWADNLD